MDTDSSMPSELNFLDLMSKLKHLDRTGWVKNGIKKPESVAAHMYRMAVMSAFVIDDPTIDLNKCIRLSIVHDMGESIVGDITPHCGVSEKDKHIAEMDAMRRISDLVNGTKGTEILELFKEHEDGKTREAKLVRDLDKFDMILQAYEYELENERPKFLQQFFDSTANYFGESHTYVQKLAKQLLDARSKNVPFDTFKTIL